MSVAVAVAVLLGSNATYPPPSPSLLPPPPAPGTKGNDGAIDLSPGAVAISAAVLLMPGLISLKLDLQMHWQLAMATVRMVLQLTLLGYILKPIFDYNSPYLVVGYACFMVFIAAAEAISRPSYTYQGMFANTLIAMALGSGLMLTYTVLVVMQLQPWWEAQYVIPMLGMLLGNCTSGISLGLSNVLDELTARCDAVEWQLSMGANRWEATEAAIRSAVKTSMTPLLNQMSVMGLVAIPGMMTGQILAGSDPSNAARYQMLIMFVVGGSSSLASVVSIYVAALHVVDSKHCFRKDKLTKRSKGSKAAPSPLWTWAHGTLKTLWRLCCFCFDEAEGTSQQGAAPASSGGRGAGRGVAAPGKDRLTEPLLAPPDVEAATFGTVAGARAEAGKGDMSMQSTASTQSNLPLPVSLRAVSGTLPKLPGSPS